MSDSKNAMKPWKWLVFLSVSLFLLSLILPGFVPDPGGRPNTETYGFNCFLFGLAALFLRRPAMVIAWAANPVYLVLLSLSLLRTKLRVHPAAAAVPFLLSLASFCVTDMATDIEGGLDFSPVHMGPGAFVWIASLLLFAPVYVLKAKD